MGLTIVVDSDSVPAQKARGPVPFYRPEAMESPWVPSQGPYVPSNLWNSGRPQLDRRSPRAPLACVGPRAPRDIVVIDKTDWTGKIAGTGYWGSTAMARTVPEVIRQVQDLAGCDPIRRLLTIDHGLGGVGGDGTGFTFGDAQIHMGNQGAWVPHFARLQGSFAADGFYFVAACQAGSNRPLMSLVARTVGVPVCAADTNLVVRAFVGVYKAVDNGKIWWFSPDGRITEGTLAQTR